MKQIDRALVTVGVLAGGASRRFGGRDKALLPVGGRAMIEWTLDAARSLGFDEILISANRNIARYRQYGYPVLTDRSANDFSGPLAGMSRLLAEASGRWVMFLPCDAFKVPADLAHRLLDAALVARADVAVLADEQRIHPTFSLVRSALADRAAEAFAAGERSPRAWFAALEHVTCDGESPINLNTPEALAELELRL